MDKFARSKAIVESAIESYRPQAIVSLVSGGTDSLTAYYVARAVGINPDYLVHVNTRTGITETTAFVYQFAASVGVPLLVGDAGDTFERYVMRKGFFGKGLRAHAYAYHMLKADPLRRVISTIRNKRRNFKVLMLTGIRLDESDNRKYNFSNRTTCSDSNTPGNVFCNLIEHWTGQDCRDYLAEIEAPQNPVTKCLHRSGECMCGTMQTEEDRTLASIFFPAWARWLADLETRVFNRHGWKWGQNMPSALTQIKAGQMELEGFQLCRHCVEAVEAE